MGTQRVVRAQVDAHIFGWIAEVNICFYVFCRMMAGCCLFAGSGCSLLLKLSQEVDKWCFISLSDKAEAAGQHTAFYGHY
jgi:hypothetical protein